MRNCRFIASLTILVVTCQWFRLGYEIFWSDPELLGRTIPTELNSGSPVYGKKYKEYRGKDGPMPPLVLVSRGCSGTTFLLEVAKNLVMQHTGLDPYVDLGDRMESEYLSPGKPDVGKVNGRLNHTLAKKKKFRAYKEMVFDTYNMISQNQSQVMLPKVLEDQLTYGMGAALKDLHARVVVTYRENVLEKSICEVRDCFFRNVPPMKYHRSVYENGETTDLCFARRTTPDVKVLAKFDKRALSETMTGLMTRWGCKEGYRDPMLAEYLDKVMSYKDGTYPRLALETLEAFEYTTYGTVQFNRSVEAWKSLLQGWGIEPRESLIVDEMRAQGIGTRTYKKVMENVYKRNQVESLFQNWANNASLCDWRWMMMQPGNDSLSQ